MAGFETCRLRSMLYSCADDSARRCFQPSSATASCLVGFSRCAPANLGSDNLVQQPAVDTASIRPAVAAKDV
jgi:hypothetical protein